MKQMTRRLPTLPLSEGLPALAEAKPTRKIIDLELFSTILKRDSNFRYYLIGRSVIFLGWRAVSWRLAASNALIFLIPRMVFTAPLYFSGIIGYSLGGALGIR